MLSLGTTGDSLIGWTVFNSDITARNIAGATRAAGSIMALAFDNEATDAADNNQDGGNDSGFACLVDPANDYGSKSAGEVLQQAGILACLLTELDDDEEDTVRLAGFVDANVRGDLQAIAKGDALILEIDDDANALQDLDAADASTLYKVYAQALTSSTLDENIKVIFDGVAGIGWHSG